MLGNLVLTIIVAAPVIFAGILGWVSIDDALGSRRAARG
jgi:hypothetical protein